MSAEQTSTQTRVHGTNYEASMLSRCLESSFQQWDAAVGLRPGVLVDTKFRVWLESASPLSGGDGIDGTTTRIWARIVDIQDLRARAKDLLSFRAQEIPGIITGLASCHAQVQFAHRALLDALEEVKDVTCDPTDTLSKLKEWKSCDCQSAAGRSGPAIADTGPDDGADALRAPADLVETERQTQGAAMTEKDCVLLNHYRAATVAYGDEFGPSHQFRARVKKLAAEVEGLEASKKSRETKDLYTKTYHERVIRAAQEHEDMLSAAPGEAGLATLESSGGRRKFQGLSVPLLECTCKSSFEEHPDWPEAKKTGEERRRKHAASRLANNAKQIRTATRARPLTWGAESSANQTLSRAEKSGGGRYVPAQSERLAL